MGEWTDLVSILVALVAGVVALLKALGYSEATRVGDAMITGIEASAEQYARVQEAAITMAEAKDEKQRQLAFQRFMAEVDRAEPKRRVQIAAEQRGIQPALHRRVKQVTENAAKKTRRSHLETT